MDIYWEIGCWSYVPSFPSFFPLSLTPPTHTRWDVCAGTIIAREAGAKVYGRHGKAFEDEDLMDHYFFVVRAVGDTAGEKGEESQDRLAKEFFAVADDWDV